MFSDDSNRCVIRNCLRRTPVLYLSNRITCRHFSHGVLRSVPIIITFVILFGVGCSSEGGPSDFIEDQIGLLSVNQQLRMGRLHRLLLNDLDIHIKTVVLADSPMNLNQAAVSLFEKSQLGVKTRGARGVLIVVDPTGEQVRVEIGYDLEGVYPDAFVGAVERDQLVPFFQTGQVGKGIEATVELFVQRAMAVIKDDIDNNERKSFAVDDYLSGGGGASVRAAIGTTPPKKTVFQYAQEFGPQSSPMLTLELYKRVLRGRIKDPDLGLYTKETRKFLRQWPVTDAQQKNELRNIESVFSKAIVVMEGHRASIRFPIEDRQASPFFLIRSDTGWMLDFASMHRIIGFNHKNQWFFRTTDHIYMFAFTDFVFDHNGFPHR